MPYQYPFRYTQESLKREIFYKGNLIANEDSNEWRTDICGAIMQYSKHGNTNSEYGWEIDHIKPQALKGSDETYNLQPLNWRNNRKKGDTYPWHCN